MVRERALDACVQLPEAFCPIDWWRAEDFHGPVELPAAAYAVHLWHEIWRWNGWRKEPCYPPQALYQQLHARYPEPPAAPEVPARRVTGSTEQLSL